MINRDISLDGWEAMSVENYRYWAISLRCWSSFSCWGKTADTLRKMHSRTLLHFQSKILKRSLVSASGVASSKAYSRGFDSRLRRRDLQRCVFRRRSRRPGREFERQPSVEVLAHDDEERRIVVAFRRPGQVSSCGVWTRAVASGGAVVPGNPFKICAPISCLAPKLLHTSNIVFLKCAHPLLRNPGDGPGGWRKESCRLTFVIFVHPQWNQSFNP